LQDLPTDNEPPDWRTSTSSATVEAMIRHENGPVQPRRDWWTEANTCTFRLEIGDARPEILAISDDASTQPIPISTLSALFTDHLRWATQVRIGGLQPDDPVASSLTAMLDGRAPWNPSWL
jgi:hypothetical protein